MKKFISTVMAIILVLAVGIGNLGCNRESDIKIDETKTQLYVSNLDQGVGRDYIEAIGAQFEEDFKNKSFEEGKTGVQVIYNHNTNINSATFYNNSIQSDSDNVYFTEYINYLQFANKFMDVTDIIESPAITGVDAGGNYLYESRSIKDKIDPVMAAFLNVGTENDPTYKAFPFYLAIKGINYDADLWNEYSFYLGKGGAPSDFVAKAVAEGGDMDTAIASYNTEMAKVNTTGESDYWYFVNAEGKATIEGTEYTFGLSAGPDGQYGTFDDGFPATYDEFYALCRHIVSKGVTPIIWTGANPGYADQLTQGLFVNDLGVDRTKTYYSLTGKMDNLVKFNGETAVIENGKAVIDDEYEFKGGLTDGYEMMRTESKLLALQFADMVASNPTWTHTACYDSTSQSEAQNKFLTEGHTKAGKKIAMLTDGAWWQAEANATFEVMKKADAKYAKENRKFGVLALPNSTIERYAEKTVNKEKNVTVPENDSYCFINANLSPTSPQYEVARVFMSYFNSDKIASLFTAQTNMLRALDVDLKNTEYYDDMSPYGKSFVEFGEGAEIVYSYTENEFMNNNRTYFQNTRDGWQFQAYSLTMGSTSAVIDTIHIYKASKGIDAKHYFEAIYRYFKTQAWPAMTN